MKVVKHKGIYGIDHDGSDFEVNGTMFRIIGTRRIDCVNGVKKYYVDIKNVLSGKIATIFHDRFCQIMINNGYTNKD